MIGLPSDYWLMNAAGFAGIIVMLLLISYSTGDWFTHAHIFSIFWGATIVGVQTGLGESPLRMETLMVLFAAWWAFLVGTIVISRGRRISGGQAARIGARRGVLALVTLLGIQLLGVAYELHALGLGPGTNPIEFLRSYPNLRLSGVLAAIQLPHGLGLFRWDHTLYLPLAMILRYQGIISRKFLLLTIAISLVCAIERFTRAPLAQITIIVLVSWLVLYRPRQRTVLIAAGAIGGLGIALFVGMQIIIIAMDPYAKSSWMQSLFSYFGGSFIAYDGMLGGDVRPDRSSLYSLDAINFILHRLTLIDSYPDLIRPYITYPITTNIYSFLDAFTIDFGVAGAIAGSAALGVVSMLFYLLAKRGQTFFSLVCYCYVVYGCVMATINNEFIRFAFPFNVVAAFAISLAIHFRGVRIVLPGRVIRVIWDRQEERGVQAA